MKNSKLDAVNLLFTDAHGQYIPQLFAQMITNGETVDKWHVTQEDVACLLLGPTNPDYWDSWETVMNCARISIDGNTFILWQDSDLWAICDALMSADERLNFGFDGQEGGD
jgi:hypothetical protein